VGKFFQYEEKDFETEISCMQSEQFDVQ